MTAPVATQTANGTAGAGKQTGGKAAAIPLRPFKVGAQAIDEEPYDRTLTQTTSARRFEQYDVPSTAYLKHIEMLVEVTTAANAATVVFTEDAPWNVLDVIDFLDTGNSEIITQITGFDLMIINKYGGYFFSDDPRASPVYFATAGVGGGLGGSAAFVLRIPVEVVVRDALGALPNKSQSTPFKVKVTLAASTSVYTTPPTTLGTVRLRMLPISYWEPTKTDSAGNPIASQPPGVGFTQYWTKDEPSSPAGSFTTDLNNSTGYPIRNLIFILRDSTGSRAQGESDFPDPFRLQLQANIMKSTVKPLWRDRIAKAFGYVGAVGDGLNTKENGVYPLWYTNDFGHKPGWENRREYLRTTDGMRLQIKGTILGSGQHKWTVLTNYVGTPGGVNLAQLTT